MQKNITSFDTNMNADSSKLISSSNLNQSDDISSHESCLNIYEDKMDQNSTINEDNLNYISNVLNNSVNIEFITSNNNEMEGNWKDNWILKEAKAIFTTSVEMLIPAPKEDVHVSIDGKTMDDISDLSEIGSDIEDIQHNLDLLNDQILIKNNEKNDISLENEKGMFGLHKLQVDYENNNVDVKNDIVVSTEKIVENSKNEINKILHKTMNGNFEEPIIEPPKDFNDKNSRFHLTTRNETNSQVDTNTNDKAITEEQIREYRNNNEHTSIESESVILEKTIQELNEDILHHEQHVAQKENETENNVTFIHETETKELYMTKYSAEIESVNDSDNIPSNNHESISCCDNSVTSQQQEMSQQQETNSVATDQSDTASSTLTLPPETVTESRIEDTHSCDNVEQNNCDLKPEDTKSDNDCSTQIVEEKSITKYENDVNSNTEISADDKFNDSSETQTSMTNHEQLEENKKNSNEINSNEPKTVSDETTTMRVDPKSSTIQTTDNEIAENVNHNLGIESVNESENTLETDTMEDKHNSNDLQTVPPTIESETLKEDHQENVPVEEIEYAKSKNDSEVDKLVSNQKETLKSNTSEISSTIESVPDSKEILEKDQKSNSCCDISETSQQEETNSVATDQSDTASSTLTLPPETVTESRIEDTHSCDNVEQNNCDLKPEDTKSDKDCSTQIVEEKSITKNETDVNSNTEISADDKFNDSSETQTSMTNHEQLEENKKNSNEIILNEPKTVLDKTTTMRVDLESSTIQITDNEIAENGNHNLGRESVNESENTLETDTTEDKHNSNDLQTVPPTIESETLKEDHQENVPVEEIEYAKSKNDSEVDELVSNQKETLKSNTSEISSTIESVPDSKEILEKDQKSNSCCDISETSQQQETNSVATDQSDTASSTLTLPPETVTESRIEDTHSCDNVEQNNCDLKPEDTKSDKDCSTQIVEEKYITKNETDVNLNTEISADDKFNDSSETQTSMTNHEQLEENKKNSNEINSNEPKTVSDETTTMRVDPKSSTIQTTDNEIAENGNHNLGIESVNESENTLETDTMEDKHNSNDLQTVPPTIESETLKEDHQENVPVEEIEYAKSKNDSEVDELVSNHKETLKSNTSEISSTIESVSDSKEILEKDQKSNSCCDISETSQQQETNSVATDQSDTASSTLTLPPETVTESRIEDTHSCDNVEQNNCDLKPEDTKSDKDCSTQIVEEKSITKNETDVNLNTEISADDKFNDSSETQTSMTNHEQLEENKKNSNEIISNEPKTVSDETTTMRVDPESSTIQTTDNKIAENVNHNLGIDSVNESENTLETDTMEDKHNSNDLQTVPPTIESETLKEDHQENVPVEEIKYAKSKNDSEVDELVSNHKETLKSNTSEISSTIESVSDSKEILEKDQKSNSCCDISETSQQQETNSVATDQSDTASSTLTLPPETVTESRIEDTHSCDNVEQNNCDLKPEDTKSDNDCSTQIVEEKSITKNETDVNLNTEISADDKFNDSSETQTSMTNHEQLEENKKNSNEIILNEPKTVSDETTTMRVDPKSSTIQTTDNEIAENGNHNLGIESVNESENTLETDTMEDKHNSNDLQTVPPTIESETLKEDHQENVPVEEIEYAKSKNDSEVDELVSNHKETLKSNTSEISSTIESVSDSKEILEKDQKSNSCCDKSETSQQEETNSVATDQSDTASSTLTLPPETVTESRIEDTHSCDNVEQNNCDLKPEDTKSDKDCSTQIVEEKSITKNENDVNSNTEISADDKFNDSSETQTSMTNHEQLEENKKNSNEIILNEPKTVSDETITMRVDPESSTIQTTDNKIAENVNHNLGIESVKESENTLETDTMEDKHNSNDLQTVPPTIESETLKDDHQENVPVEEIEYAKSKNDSEVDELVSNHKETLKSNTSEISSTIEPVSDSKEILEKDQKSNSCCDISETSQQQETNSVATDQSDTASSTLTLPPENATKSRIEDTHSCDNVEQNNCDLKPEDTKSDNDCSTQIVEEKSITKNENDVNSNTEISADDKFNDSSETQTSMTNHEQLEENKKKSNEIILNEPKTVSDETTTMRVDPKSSTIQTTDNEIAENGNHNLGIESVNESENTLETDTMEDKHNSSDLQTVPPTIESETLKEDHQENVPVEEIEYAKSKNDSEVDELVSNHKETLKSNTSEISSTIESVSDSKEILEKDQKSNSCCDKSETSQQEETNSVATDQSDTASSTLTLPPETVTESRIEDTHSCDNVEQNNCDLKPEDTKSDKDCSTQIVEEKSITKNENDVNSNTEISADDKFNDSSETQTSMTNHEQLEENKKNSNEIILNEPKTVSDETITMRVDPESSTIQTTDNKIAENVNHNLGIESVKESENTLETDTMEDKHNSNDLQTVPPTIESETLKDDHQENVPVEEIEYAKSKNDSEVDELVSNHKETLKSNTSEISSTIEPVSDSKEILEKDQKSNSCCDISETSQQQETNSVATDQSDTASSTLTLPPENATKSRIEDTHSCDNVEQNNCDLKPEDTKSDNDCSTQIVEEKSITKNENDVNSNTEISANDKFNDSSETQTSMTNHEQLEENKKKSNEIILNEPKTVSDETTTMRVDPKSSTIQTTDNEIAENGNHNLGIESVNESENTLETDTMEDKHNSNDLQTVPPTIESETLKEDHQENVPVEEIEYAKSKNDSEVDELVSNHKETLKSNTSEVSSTIESVSDSKEILEKDQKSNSCCDISETSQQEETNSVATDQSDTASSTLTLPPENATKSRIEDTHSCDNVEQNNCDLKPEDTKSDKDCSTQIVEEKSITKYENDVNSNTEISADDKFNDSSETQTSMTNHEQLEENKKNSNEIILNEPKTVSDETTTMRVDPKSSTIQTTDNEIAENVNHNLGIESVNESENTLETDTMEDKHNSNDLQTVPPTIESETLKEDHQENVPVEEIEYAKSKNDSEVDELVSNHKETLKSNTSEVSSTIEPVSDSKEILEKDQKSNSCCDISETSQQQETNSVATDQSDTASSTLTLPPENATKSRIEDTHSCDNVEQNNCDLKPEDTKSDKDCSTQIVEENSITKNENDVNSNTEISADDKFNDSSETQTSMTNHEQLEENKKNSNEIISNEPKTVSDETTTMRVDPKSSTIQTTDNEIAENVNHNLGIESVKESENTLETDTMEDKHDSNDLQTVPPTIESETLKDDHQENVPVEEIEYAKSKNDSEVDELVSNHKETLKSNTSEVSSTTESVSDSKEILEKDQKSNSCCDISETSQQQETNSVATDQSDTASSTLTLPPENATKSRIEDTHSCDNVEQNNCDLKPEDTKSDKDCSTQIVEEKSITKYENDVNSNTEISADDKFNDSSETQTSMTNHEQLEENKKNSNEIISNEPKTVSDETTTMRVDPKSSTIQTTDNEIAENVNHNLGIESVKESENTLETDTMEDKHNSNDLQTVPPTIESETLKIDHQENVPVEEIEYAKSKNDSEVDELVSNHRETLKSNTSEISSTIESVSDSKEILEKDQNDPINNVPGNTSCSNYSEAAFNIMCSHNFITNEPLLKSCVADKDEDLTSKSTITTQSYYVKNDKLSYNSDNYMITRNSNNGKYDQNVDYTNSESVILEKQSNISDNFCDGNKNEKLNSSVKQSSLTHYCEGNLSQSEDNSTHSEDNDVIRIYNLNKQEMKIVKQNVTEKIISTDPKSKSIASKTHPSILSVTNKLSSSRKIVTPVALKFLQPKRKIFEPEQIMSDLEGTSSPVFEKRDIMPATSVTNKIPEKSVIEPEVIPALPSVKALAKAFLLTSAKCSSKHPEKSKMENTENISNDKRAKPSPDSYSPPYQQMKYNPIEPLLTQDLNNASGTSEHTDNMSCNENDSEREKDNIPVERPISPVLEVGKLKTNIAFFENLKKN